MERIVVEHKGVGVEFKDFSPEAESYFLKREYEKKEIGEEEIENYKKLLSRVLKDGEFCEYLGEQLLISPLLDKVVAEKM